MPDHFFVTFVNYRETNRESLLSFNYFFKKLLNQFFWKENDKLLSLHTYSQLLKP